MLETRQRQGADRRLWRVIFLLLQDKVDVSYSHGCIMCGEPVTPDPGALPSFALFPFGRGRDGLLL